MDREQMIARLAADSAAFRRPVRKPCPSDWSWARRVVAVAFGEIEAGEPHRSPEGAVLALLPDTQEKP